MSVSGWLFLGLLGSQSEKSECFVVDLKYFLYITKEHKEFTLKE